MPTGHYPRKSPSAETRRKIGLANSIALKGKKHSDERRRKNSEGHSGKKAYNWKGGYQRKLWHNRQRRIKKLQVGGSHTLGDWENLQAQYNWTCPCCGKQEPDITLSEDHIIPLSKGGSDNIENIQPLCRSCNSSKQTKIITYLIIKD